MWLVGNGREKREKLLLNIQKVISICYSTLMCQVCEKKLIFCINGAVIVFLACNVELKTLEASLFFPIKEMEYSIISSEKKLLHKTNQHS